MHGLSGENTDESSMQHDCSARLVVAIHMSARPILAVELGKSMEEMHT